MLDFAKYLASRELVTTGLTKFDDNPESFRAWEFSFVNAMQDLQLSANEELDLLVKSCERCMLLIGKLLSSCLGRDFKNAMPPRK